MGVKGRGRSGRGGSRGAFPADLPVLEERSRRGEALEGHDRPPAAGGGTVAPAEGLSAAGPRARGPPSQLPAPSRGAPGQGPAGQRPGSRGPCGRRGTEPPDPPGSPLPGVWGARSRPQPRPRRCQKRCPPIPIPTTGQDFCECFQPHSRSPSAPPTSGGHAAGARGTPPPSPLSSIKPLGAASGATEPPLPRPVPAAPPECPGAGGGHRGEGTAPFPGIGSHDTVPYPKRAPSCTAFSRVRCFTSVLGLGGRGGSLSRPGHPRPCPHPQPGQVGAPRGDAEPHRVPFQPGRSGSPVPTPGDKGWSERCCPHPWRAGDISWAGGIPRDSQPGRISASSSIPTEPRDAHARPLPAPWDPQNQGQTHLGAPQG